MHEVSQEEFFTRVEATLKDGWCQGKFGNFSSPDGGPVCLHGAAFRVESQIVLGTEEKLVGPIYRKGPGAVLVKVIEEQYSDRLSSVSGVNPIPVFNDHNDTTFEDVLAVVEKAKVTDV